jgi:hypothetical protein
MDSECDNYLLSQNILKTKYMNLISITPHRDTKGKECLKVELTIDGATKIAESYPDPISISDLWDNEPDKSGLKRLFSPGQIDSTVFVPQENRLYTINIYKTEDKEAYYPVEKWMADPKAIILYYPHKDNESKLAEVTAKLGANQWAVYSDEPLAKVAIETGDRHGLLCRASEKVNEAIQIFNYGKYNQDKIYRDLLRNSAKEIEKEIDYMKEKMKIMQLVSNNDFNLSETVAKLYKKYRGVTEQSIPKIKLVENGTKEQVAENASAPDSEGQNGESIGSVGSN